MNFNTDLIELHNIGNKCINNIESFFKILKDKNHIKNTDPKEYNLQLKICVLLYNIKIFVEKYNIKPKFHHKLWMQENFDFPIIKVNDNIKNNKNYNININQQNNILKNKANIQKRYFGRDHKVGDIN